MLRILFILLFSTNVFAELDDPFKPLIYVVGESTIKDVIGSNSDFSIQWTESSAKNASVIATGANVLSPLIDKFESLLTVAAQNSESGVTGTGTVVTTGSLSNALLAIGVAQSGVALENILYLSTSTFSNKSMGLLYSNNGNNTIYSVLQKQPVSYSSQFDKSLINIKSTALSQDLERRSNQLKARGGFGCQPYAKYISTPAVTVADVSSYCEPNKAKWNVYFEGYDGVTDLGSSGVINHYASKKPKHITGTVNYMNLNKSGNSYFISVDGYNYKKDCYFVRGGSLVAENCFPDHSFSYNCSTTFFDDDGLPYCQVGPFFSINMVYLEKGCPVGLVHASSLFIPEDVIVCIIPLSNSLTGDIVRKESYSGLNLMPVFELYPNFKFQINPYISKKDIPYFFLSLNGDYVFLTLNDPNNPLIFSVIALKVFSDGFLLSRTVGGIKINRHGSITTEVDLQIREIEKYDFSFNLVKRELSFWTGDGFDIGIDNSFLSPKTYGIAGKTIAGQFAIRTISSTMVLPKDNKKGSDGGVVPCGLGKDVQVLKTRENAEGKDENYFEIQSSPACTVDWGKMPNANNVKNFKQLCPKEGEEGYSSECKEDKFFEDIFGKLKDKISLDSDSFKIKDITSTKCVPLKLDFAGAGNWLGGGGVHEIKIICEMFEKSPNSETLFRTFFMISWFITALFRLLST
jgi:hypothetical protein